MKRVSVILVTTASTLLFSAAAWRADRPSSPHELHVRSEVARLRAHFDSVDTELRTRDVSHLSREQRANRAKHIAWLKEYREAGKFPLNNKFIGQAVPFFRDSNGTLCAMAYLVDRSGRGDIVDHIAKTRNYAYIPELTDDRKLVAWLEESGLSAAEAARIQPAYNGGPCCLIDDPIVPDNKVDGDYALLSVGLGGSSLGTLGFNLFSPSRVSGAAGLMAGAGAIIAGVAHWDDYGDRRVARANVAIGSIAVLASLRGLLHSPSLNTRASAPASKYKLVNETQVAPDLIISPTETRVGLRMRARF